MEHESRFIRRAFPKRSGPCAMKRTKYWRRTTLLAAVFLVQGCRYGMSVKNFPAAQGPKGAIVQVTTEQQPFAGELIEVRDTGLVVLTDRTLRLLPYSAIVSSHIDNTGSQYAVR